MLDFDAKVGFAVNGPLAEGSSGSGSCATCSEVSPSNCEAKDGRASWSVPSVIKPPLEWVAAAIDIEEGFPIHGIEVT